jgi:hypothetical protein
MNRHEYLQTTSTTTSSSTSKRPNWSDRLKRASALHAVVFVNNMFLACPTCDLYQVTALMHQSRWRS